MRAGGGVGRGGNANRLQQTVPASARQWAQVLAGSKQDSTLTFSIDWGHGLQPEVMLVLETQPKCHRRFFTLEFPRAESVQCPPLEVVAIGPDA